MDCILYLCDFFFFLKWSCCFYSQYSLIIIATKSFSTKIFSCCLLAMTLAVGKFLGSLNYSEPGKKHMIYNFYFYFFYQLENVEKVQIPHVLVQSGLCSELCLGFLTLACHDALVWSKLVLQLCFQVSKKVGEAFCFRKLWNTRFHCRLTVWFIVQARMLLRARGHHA